MLERFAFCMTGSLLLAGCGANHAGAQLRNADLAGADLQSAKLQGADLRGADLRGADLESTDLRGVDLRDATLGLVWDRDEPQPGVYDFSVVDDVVRSFSQHDVHLLITITAFNTWDQGVTTIPPHPKFHGDVRVGAEVLCRAALADDFADASGRYFDNEVESSTA